MVLHEAARFDTPRLVVIAFCSRSSAMTEQAGGNANVGRVVNRAQAYIWPLGCSPHDEFTNSREPRGGRYLQCCRSPLALAARFDRKDGGAHAHRSMQQHQGFSLDSKAETTWAHLPLYRRGGRR